MMMKGTEMTHSDLDLSKNLTEKRIPAEMRGVDAYRLIIWEIDQDAGGKLVQDIIEAPVEMAIYFFNKNRVRWSAEGLRVTLDRVVYS